MLGALVQDLRYAARSLRKSPGFTAVAVLTVGLGIGANTAIFSVLQAVLLRPLPYTESDRLVYVRGELRNRDVYNWPISQRILLDMRERSTLMESLAGVVTSSNTLIGGEGDPVQVGFAAITPNLFSVLGARPAIGRDFAAEDAAPLGDDTDPDTIPPAAIILSHRLWQNRFGSDPEIIGRSVQLGGGAVEIVGVMPPDFKLFLPPDSMFSPEIDVWFAPRFDLVNADRRQATFEVIGRLAGEATVAQAQAEMGAVVAFLHEISESSRGAGYNLRVVPMQREITAQVRPIVLALVGAVGFVLLIACANVSNLLLVRASARGGEIAIRSALGGSRARLIRQLLTESIALASLGAVVGLLLARVGIDGLMALGPPEFPRMETVGIDATVLLFTLATSLVAAVVFGTLPALQASRERLAEVLKDRGRGSLLAGLGVLRNGIIVVEVALSVVLLIGAGLMLRSFVELQRAEPGFETEGAVTFELQLTGSQYGRDQRVVFVDELRQRLEGLPGVEAVSAANALPLHGAAALGRYGTEEALDDDALYGQADYRYVHLDYFRAMGTRLLEGRVFDAADFAGDGASVVLVDEFVAGRLWPGESAVGKTLVIRMGPDPERMEVIGVVEHQRSESPAIDSKEAVTFNARRVGDPNTLQWIVRTRGDAASLAGPVRAEVAAMDESLPVSKLRTMADAVGEAMAPTRFALVAIAVFASLALALALVGLYSVLAYVVRQRTAEIGLRMAFGAQSGSILSLVVRQAMVPTVAGIAFGLLVAFWLTSLGASLLVQVSPTDPATFVATSVVFVATAILASLVPALRAMRVDPAQALRE